MPAADVAGEAAAPAADVAALPVSPASRRPEASATSVAACSAGVSPAGAGKGLPAPWQELDPRAYQPRPFGPMETDPDWPGKPEEEDPLPPAPAVSTPVNAGGGWAIRQVDASGGLAIAPPSGDPLPDLEDVCWLCEDEAEFYDPSGQAWCSFCIAEAGKSEGWQDLLDLLPASWQRRAESNRQLAAYAAAHYHGAGRRKIALRWSQPPFHQTLQGADLFRAFARWLAAPERWKQREAERQLERLVEHQGLGV